MYTRLTSRPWPGEGGKGPVLLAVPSFNMQKYETSDISVDIFTSANEGQEQKAAGLTVLITHGLTTLTITGATLTVSSYGKGKGCQQNAIQNRGWFIAVFAAASIHHTKPTREVRLIKMSDPTTAREPDAQTCCENYGWSENKRRLGRLQSSICSFHRTVTT